MFYDKFKELCDRNGVSCNKAALEIGLSNATPTTWKKRGLTPKADTLAKIADYFGVTTDYLLGVQEETPDKKIECAALYERIESLCKAHNMNITQMCREAGVPRGNLTDLKMGRQSGLSAKNLKKIADYFEVSVDFLLCEKETLTDKRCSSAFYDNFVKLCADRNETPSGVARKIGLSNAAASGWKKGKLPSDTTISKLCDYFGVTAAELTGKEEPSSYAEELNKEFVRRLLDLTPNEEEKVIAFIAGLIAARGD